MSKAAKKTKSRKKVQPSSSEFRNVKSVKRERLILERKNKGLTQGQLAELLGISTSMVSHIENGRFLPSADVCLMLQHTFDVPYEILIPDF